MYIKLWSTYICFANQITMLSSYPETPVFANTVMFAESCSPPLYLFCSRVCAYTHTHMCHTGTTTYKGNTSAIYTNLSWTVLWHSDQRDWGARASLKQGSCTQMPTAGQAAAQAVPSHALEGYRSMGLISAPRHLRPPSFMAIDAVTVSPSGCILKGTHSNFMPQNTHS